jgi:hypothetical protein
MAKPDSERANTSKLKARIASVSKPNSEKTGVAPTDKQDVD